VTRTAPPLAAVVVVTALFSPAYGRALDAAASGGTTVNSLGMRLVPVPAGSFSMGSAPGAPLRQEEELPHQVILTRPFRIASTEVTQRQWLAIMPTNRSPQPGDDLPVTSVSWKEAQEFCRKLSQREGVRYRLPTEAEWECACRAGAGDAPVGRAELEAVAWYADDSGEKTHPVGQKMPNAWGLFDLLGNVAEWTLDAYGPYPRASPATDPTGPPTGSTRVVRGGAWRSFPPAVRCAARTGAPESYQLSHVGLRVVQETD
jgi:formylglycine-generating enzyme required for sulfatase activity